MMTRIFRAKLLLLSLAAALALTVPALLIAPVAGASSARAAKKHKVKHKAKKKPKKVAGVRITGGSETIVFDATVAQALEKGKVTITDQTPTTGTLASGFLYTITGGTLNPGTGLGSVKTSGGLTLATSFSVPGLFSSETNATISEPGLTLNSAPTLSMTSSQSTPPTFPFALVKSVRPSLHGKTITLSKMTATLTAAGAQVLNGFASGFSAGEAFATITVQATH